MRELQLKTTVFYPGSPPVELGTGAEYVVLCDAQAALEELGEVATGLANALEDARHPRLQGLGNALKIQFRNIFFKQSDAQCQHHDVLKRALNIGQPPPG
jgi:hypothetical protein